jgi:uncharacterized protein YkwD
MSSKLLRGLRRTACFTAAALLPLSARPQMPTYRVLPRITIAEQYLLRSINAERAAVGLRPVHFSLELQEAARGHALLMARMNSLEHQLRGEPDLLHRGVNAGARFYRITENIGVGPSILDMHVALMHSPHHRENILDEQVSAIGISVIQVRGYFWAVEDFSDAAG